MNKSPFYKSRFAFNLQSKPIPPWVILCFFSAIFLIFNAWLSYLTWGQIRNDLGFVRMIPQPGGEFKLRHIIQYSPQSFIISYILFNKFNLSKLKSTILGISFVFACGNMSELIQIYIPTRIPSALDVLWDLLGGILGGFIFYNFEFLKKIFAKNLKLTLFLLSISLISVLYTNLFSLNFFLQDSFRLLTATKSPFADTFSYWWYILTNPTNNTQYRPISYFFWMYWQRPFFELTVWKYQAMGLLIFTLTAHSIFYWLYSIEKLILPAFVGTLLFIIFPWNFYFIAAITYPLKYFFPIMITGYFLGRLNKFDYKMPTTELIIFVFLFTLTIMSQEGSLVLPIIALLFSVIHHGVKKVHNTYFILIPVVIYLYFRVFIFKIPNQGFMEISYIFPLKSIPSFIWLNFYSLFTPSDSGITNTSLFMGSLLLLTIFLWVFKNVNNQQSYALKTLILIIVPLLPFSLLVNHFSVERGYWIILGFCFLIYLYAQKLWSLDKKRLSRKIGILFLILFFVNSTLQTYLFNNRLLSSIINERGKPQIELINLVKESVKGIPNDQPILVKVPQINYWVNFSVLPSFLALHFPNNHFLIVQPKSFNSDLILVQNGSYFLFRDYNLALDPYNFPTPLGVPKTKRKIDLTNMPHTFH